MRYHSDLEPAAYLSAVKDRIDPDNNFGTERFTGLFLGSFFYVTHHSDYEHDRQYKIVTNTAMGYIRKDENGSEIRFLTAKGLLRPIPFLLILGCLLVVLIIGVMQYGTFHFWPLFGLSAAITLLVGGFETLMESMTERSREGRKVLLAFLLDPADPFSYLNHSEDIG